MDWEKITEKDFSLHRVSTLIYLILASMVFLMTVIIPFLKGYIDNIWVELVLMLLVEATIIFVWYYNRSVFPFGNSKKHNLVIAITTENETQKNRIRKDFTNAINKRLKHLGLDKYYSVLVLHNHLSEVLKQKLEEYYHFKKLSTEEDTKKGNKIIEKLAMRMHASFFIYGDLILRNFPNAKYSLKTDALMLHAFTTSENQNILNDEFKKHWKSDVSFLEEEELTGFESNAEQVFFTATYLLGLATFTDNNFLKGIDIWTKLEAYIDRYPEFEEHRERIKSLKAFSCKIYARLLYDQGKVEESIHYREIYLEIDPDELGRYLNNSIREVSVNKNPKKALEEVEKAKKVSGYDGTWRYNKFYILLELNRFDDAYQVFEEILINSFDVEEDVVNQVIHFNENLILENESYLQCYLIIGAFYFKKIQNFSHAYVKLEEFIKRSEGREEWELFNIKAKSFLNELDKILGINS